MKYRKKPVVIEAIVWNGRNEDELVSFMYGGEETVRANVETNEFEISTLEGVMKASIGDYVIKGVQGEFYPCKPDIFESTYEKV